MGSTFVTLDPNKSDTKRIFGIDKPQQIWLQFVPGIVGDVVTNTESTTYDKPDRKVSRRLINSILAKPHIGNNLKSTGLLDEDDRYYPLFRGMVDVPMIGDQVLLCTMGGVQYYLGPINTAGLPSYNPDHLEVDDIRGFFTEHSVTEKNKLGLSVNFRENSGTTRLEKKFNIDLDDSDNQRVAMNHPEHGDQLSDIHGDMLFEGRHGNSIRIGSRDIYPYIIISNKNISVVETVEQGSTIAMLDRGSIRQHFSMDSIDFELASDKLEANDSKRKIGDSLYNYNFGSETDFVENQLLLNSDRVTINARTDSIFLSSFKNITIGTGNNFTLKTKNVCILDANNIYIGQEAKEPLVLGFKLVDVLEKMIKAIGQLQVGATVGGISAPVQGSGSPGWIQLETLGRELSSCLSNWHFIEDNEVQK